LLLLLFVVTFVIYVCYVGYVVVVVGVDLLFTFDLFVVVGWLRCCCLRLRYVYVYVWLRSFTFVVTGLRCGYVCCYVGSFDCCYVRLLLLLVDLLRCYVYV